MTEVVIRKWGNSLGVVLPSEFVESRKLKEGDEIGIEVFKKADLSKIFGTLKTNISAQEFKDMAREGWE